LKVVFPTCCGVDVHKSFLVATIIKTQRDSLQPSYQKKRFSTFNRDLNRFADWLHQNEYRDVCVESIGKYWVPVFNILEKRDIHVVIANPKWVKAVKGNKDDTKYSKWIGDLFRIGLVKSSFIPAKDIRILCELTRYRYKLTSMLSAGETWNPVDLFKMDMPEHLKEQQLAKAVKQAVRFLEAQGLKVS